MHSRKHSLYDDESDHVDEEVCRRERGDGVRRSLPDDVEEMRRQVEEMRRQIERERAEKKSLERELEEAKREIEHRDRASSKTSDTGSRRCERIIQRMQDVLNSVPHDVDSTLQNIATNAAARFDREWPIVQEYFDQTLTRKFRDHEINEKEFEEEVLLAREFGRQCLYSEEHGNTCGILQRIAFPMTEQDEMLSKAWRNKFPHRHPIVANWMLSMRVCRNAIYNGPPVPCECAPTFRHPHLGKLTDVGASFPNGCKSNCILKRYRTPIGNVDLGDRLSDLSIADSNGPNASSQSRGGSNAGFHVPGVVCLSKECQGGKTPELQHKIIIDMLLGTSQLSIIATHAGREEYTRFKRLFDKDFEYVASKMKERVRCLPECMQKKQYLDVGEYIVDPANAFFKTGLRNRGPEQTRFVHAIQSGRPLVYVMLFNARNIRRCIDHIIRTMKEQKALHYDKSVGRWNLCLVIDEAHHAFREFRRRNPEGMGDMLQRHLTMFFYRHEVLEELIREERQAGTDMTKLVERVRNCAALMGEESYRVRVASVLNMFHTTLVTATVMSIGLTGLLRVADVNMIRCNENDKHARPGAHDPKFDIPRRTYKPESAVQTIANILREDRKNGLHTNIPIITSGTYAKLREKCDELHRRFENEEDPVFIFEGFFSTMGDSARILCNEAGKKYLRWICVAEHQLFIDSKDSKIHGVKNGYQDANGRWSFPGGGKMYTRRNFRRLGATADQPIDISNLPSNTTTRGWIRGILKFPMQGRCNYRLQRRYDMLQRAVQLEHQHNDEEDDDDNYNSDAATADAATKTASRPHDRVRILYLSSRQLKEAVSVETSCHIWKPTALMFLPLGIRNPVTAMERQACRDFQEFQQRIGRMSQICTGESFRGTGIYFPSEDHKILSERITQMNNEFVAWMTTTCGKADDTRTLWEAVHDHTFDGPVWFFENSQEIDIPGDAYRHVQQYKMDAIRHRPGSNSDATTSPSSSDGDHTHSDSQSTVDESATLSHASAVATSSQRRRRRVNTSFFSDSQSNDESDERFRGGSAVVSSRRRRLFTGTVSNAAAAAAIDSTRACFMTPNTKEPCKRSASDNVRSASSAIKRRKMHGAACVTSRDNIDDCCATSEYTPRTRSCLRGGARVDYRRYYSDDDVTDDDDTVSEACGDETDEWKPDLCDDPQSSADEADGS